MAINIGVIGLGVMGQRMLTRLAEHPAAKARIGWDPDPKAVAAARARFPDLKIAGDADELVHTRRLHCLYVASPPGSHIEHSNRGFDAQLPVLCEKPLTTDIAEARRAIARIERESCKNAVNFALASSPGLAALEEAAKEGGVGTLKRVEIVVAFKQWPRPWQAAAGRWLAERREGGFTREVLSHFVFLLQRVLGPARIESSKVDYPADNVGAERALSARLAAGGVPVMIEGRVAGEREDANRMTLIGSEGAVELHDWFGIRRRRGDDGEWAAEGSPQENRALGQTRQLDQLVAMVEDRKHTLPSFSEALEVQRTIEALLRP